MAIIGDNGTGKTTLLKIINELVPPDTGSIKLGSNVQIGYYDQEHHVLHMDKTLFEEISDDYPDLTNTQDVYKRQGCAYLHPGLLCTLCLFSNKMYLY